ncbi:MAG: hypothetical protein HYZ45_10325 [Burkholderiales bacterium]|nr:hypothetical protein [Burkholderiales bacterium]
MNAHQMLGKTLVALEHLAAAQHTKLFSPIAPKTKFHVAISPRRNAFHGFARYA